MRRVLIAAPIAIAFTLLFSPLASAHEALPPPEVQPICSLSAWMVRGEPGQGAQDLRIKWKVTAPVEIASIKHDIRFEEKPNGGVYMDSGTTKYPGTNKTESGSKDFTVKNVNAAHRGFVELKATLIDGSSCSAELQVRIEPKR